MKLKILKQLDVCGKTVLLRSDLNSDIVKGKVIKGERIKESLKSINFLKKAGAKVVVLAHQGNPGKKNFLSLRQHAKLMDLRFVADVVGEKAVKAINRLKDGDAILLDNVRNVDDEFHPRKRGNLFAKKLLPLVDVYVNDAFSVSHRDHFSIVGFAKVKDKGIGLLFEKEVLAARNIRRKGCVFVLGGAKGESDIRLLGKGNKVLACGLFGQACLAAKGFDFGYQNGFLRRTLLTKLSYDGFLKNLRNKLKSVFTPVDFAVETDGERREFGLRDFPRSERIDDIGAETIERYCKVIQNAKSVYMKGPVGFAEDARFRKGTVEILKAVAACRGFSLVGGGQLAEVIGKSGIAKKKFGHISLSGGALLRLVAGERLVGLEVLGYYN